MLFLTMTFRNELLITGFDETSEIKRKRVHRNFNFDRSNRSAIDDGSKVEFGMTLSELEYADSLRDLKKIF